MFGEPAMKITEFFGKTAAHKHGHLQIEQVLLEPAQLLAVTDIKKQSNLNKATTTPVVRVIPAQTGAKPILLLILQQML